MDYRNVFLLTLAILFFHTTISISGNINRKEVVSRHNILLEKTIPESPTQVGNGNFAFGVDITGLQTFVPFATLSNWSWCSDPLPQGASIKDYDGVCLETNGRAIRYETDDPQKPEISKWLSANPHRFNLGRIGLKLIKKNGSTAKESDLSNAKQEVNLWTGLVVSRFMFEDQWVEVTTACHSTVDAIGITIKSPLVAQNKLFVFFDFPDGSSYTENGSVGNYDNRDNHKSTAKTANRSAQIYREIDNMRYYATIEMESPSIFKASQIPHNYNLTSTKGDKITFTCTFSKESVTNTPTLENVLSQSAKMWEAYWKSGAFIDLSSSKDIRWKELERRVVLSQYLMRLNEAGTLPPQESGLVNNEWFGRFHFEMIWWHGVHYSLWGREELLNNYIDIYNKYLPTSIQRAQRQGYNGVRWPKCTADIDREWPHIIHATLIWQQPHPIYFAEQDYRLNPTPKTLNKWKDVVFETAEFMADYPYYDEQTNKSILGPHLTVVSENTNEATTKNPAFELGYWRYGLRVAQLWRERMGMEKEAKWDKTLQTLSDLPQQQGVYVIHENIEDMWSKYNFEHPALIGTFGMLPGDGVDKEVFARTLNKVIQTWDFNKTWGWDFPMMAMACARSGESDQAINFLLHPAPGFQFDAHGLATGGPFPYFPANGGLLTAVAMMVAGWDGSNGDTPGFPNNGQWVVKHEGFKSKMQ